MKKAMLGILLTAGLTFILGSRAEALIFVEDFEAPFPAWESGWLGTNSDLQNYYGIGAGRGNNPDGLWISKAEILFDAPFGSTITSFDIDIANWTNFSFEVYDTSNNLLLNQPLSPNYGAYTDPGTYWNLSTTSSNGISRLVFNGSGVVGNTSIDNVVVDTGSQDGNQGGGNVIPEPATMALLGSGLLGVVGLRKKRSQKRKGA